MKYGENKSRERKWLHIHVHMYVCVCWLFVCCSLNELYRKLVICKWKQNIQTYSHIHTDENKHTKIHIYFIDFWKEKKLFLAWMLRKIFKLNLIIVVLNGFLFYYSFRIFFGSVFLLFKKYLFLHSFFFSFPTFSLNSLAVHPFVWLSRIFLLFLFIIIFISLFHPWTLE